MSDERLSDQQPTSIRHLVVSIATLMALLLYLDRLAIGIAKESIVKDFGMTEGQMAPVVAAFFWSYALAQVPAGWLSDRFGARWMLTIYILAWSVFTGLLGVVHSVGLVLILRLLCGLAQAGAYPTAGGLIRVWYPLSARGVASAIVALGGRAGGVLAPLLTARLIVYFGDNGWRTTMIVYGLFGVAVAVAFFIIVRDLPRLHHWCNTAERHLIEGESVPTAAKDPPFPLVAILKDVSLWGNSSMQFFTNIGWLFVVLYFPGYLDKVHGVDLETRATMTAIPTAAGILGMYLGGWWTDVATKISGRKWGRRFPVLATRITAGLGYVICLTLSLTSDAQANREWLPWAFVAALSLMAFSVDMGNPAVWGYAQDVGGKFTGSILGWANMWGNIGAAVAPYVYTFILGESPTITQWNWMFAACMTAFALSALCSLVMDSTKPLVSNQDITV